MNRIYSDTYHNTDTGQSDSYHVDIVDLRGDFRLSMKRGTMLNDSCRMIARRNNADNLYYAHYVDYATYHNDFELRPQEVDSYIKMCIRDVRHIVRKYGKIPVMIIVYNYAVTVRYIVTRAVYSKTK